MIRSGASLRPLGAQSDTPHPGLSRMALSTSGPSREREGMTEVKVGDRVGMRSSVNGGIYLGTVLWAGPHTVAVHWTITQNVTRVQRSWVFNIVEHWRKTTAKGKA